MTIWDEWADADGELGPIYGYQWRCWPTARRPARSTSSRTSSREIRRNPDSRRLIVSAWNVGDIPRMKLPPCHAFFQFYVADGRAVAASSTSAAADIFLGVPFNIASYALLTHMVAQQCDLGVGDFVWTGGDCHLYLNHLEQVDDAASRAPLSAAAASSFAASRRRCSTTAYDDFEIVGYQSPTRPIKAPVAV